MADITIRYGDTNKPLPLIYLWNEDDTPKDLTGMAFYLEVRKADNMVEFYDSTNSNTSAPTRIYTQGNALMWLIERYEIEAGSYTYAIKIFDNNEYHTIYPAQGMSGDGSIIVLPEKVKK